MQQVTDPIRSISPSHLHLSSSLSLSLQTNLPVIFYIGFQFFFALGFQRTIRQNFQTFQTYFVVCVIYFILTFTVSSILRFIEKKLDGKENYTIFGSQSNPDAEIHVSKEEEIPND